MLFSLYYYNLFNTFFSTLAGINPNSTYNYKSITIGIFREINNRGFIIGNLIVVSALVITIKIVIVRKEFIIFEFIGN